MSTTTATTAWKGPFGGVPPFDTVTPSSLRDMVLSGMNVALKNVQSIAENEAAPTFENTMLEYERAQRDLERASSIYQVFTSNVSNDTIREIEKELEPKFSEFRDTVNQNKKLFDRIDKLHQKLDTLGAEEKRLVEVTHQHFRQEGAMLNETSKQRVKEINSRLAALFTDFSQKILKEEETYIQLGQTDLAGLAPDFVEAAAEAAKAKSLPVGTFIVENTRSAVEPFLSTSTRRDLREAVFRQFVQRGANANANNTSETIKEILQLRLERSKLMGFPTHVHWRMENTMAKTPENAQRLMEQVWSAATKRVREEVAAMEAIAGHKIEAWDYRFFAEKVRLAQFALDLEEVKPYFQLENMKQALFFVANKLFGLSFSLTKEKVPVFHPDVQVYEVHNDVDGSFAGLWYFDPFARNGEKRSGAWMTEYRAQETFDGVVAPIVSNNANFMKATEGSPVLISFDDANTLFHEFGHALHGLLSRCKYPDLAGTRVYVDYVEFPSQLLEHWMLVPEVLQRFAVNVQNQALPQDYVDKIQRSMRFNKGFDTVEYLASALVDLRIHLEATPVTDVLQFEKRVLAELGMPSEIAMRHCTHHFSHIWSSDHYAAAYWSYLQSDVLVSDAYEAFGSNPFDADVAGRLKQFVFSMGNKVDPAEAYKMFRLREPTTEALMRKRGFA